MRASVGEPATSPRTRPVVESVGVPGDHAVDAPGTVQMLQRAAGNRAVARLLDARSAPRPAPRRRLARLGQGLDVPLAPGADTPAFGEDTGKQRRWSRDQYDAMWEAEQGRKLSPADENLIKFGCIGITLNNLGVAGNPPLDEAYSTFKQARDIVTARNGSEGQFAPNPWVVFAVHFWSNQDPDLDARAKPDPTAFLPDASGKVDMSGYKFLEQKGFVNFDFAFWDEASNSHWHANHCDPTVVAQAPCNVPDEMQVFQSTREVFSATFVDKNDKQTRYEYPDFDREVFVVARAQHYDPSRAGHPGLTSPRFMGPDGTTPDRLFQKVFDRNFTIKPGMSGRHVKIIQQMLVESGYDLGTFGPKGDGVDTRFGKKTEAAVAAFKVDHNLFAPTIGEVDRGVIVTLDTMFPGGP